MKIKRDSIIHPLPNEDLIKDCEEDWEVKLPEDYRNFLMNYGGCKVVENAFNDASGIDYVIDRFLTILADYKNDNGWYDIDVIMSPISWRLTANEDLIGVEMLPIAVLFAGDLLCLDFRETPEAPTVCVWYHEESGDFDPVTSTVAQTFTEFLGMLYDGLAE